MSGDILNIIAQYATTAVTFNTIIYFDPGSAYNKSLWRNKALFESRGLVPYGIDTPQGLTWYEYYLNRNRTFYGRVLMLYDGLYNDGDLYDISVVEDDIVIFYRRLSVPAWATGDVIQKTSIWHDQAYVKQLPDLSVVVVVGDIQYRVEHVTHKLREAKWCMPGIERVFLLMLVDEYGGLFVIRISLPDRSALPDWSALPIGMTGVIRLFTRSDIVNLVFAGSEYDGNDDHNVMLLERNGSLSKMGPLGHDGDISIRIPNYQLETKVINLVDKSLYAMMANEKFGMLSTSTGKILCLAEPVDIDYSRNGVSYRFIVMDRFSVMTPNRTAYRCEISHHYYPTPGVTLRTISEPLTHSVQYIQQSGPRIYAIVDPNTPIPNNFNLPSIPYTIILGALIGFHLYFAL